MGSIPTYPIRFLIVLPKVSSVYYYQDDVEIDQAEIDDRNEEILVLGQSLAEAEEPCLQAGQADEQERRNDDRAELEDALTFGRGPCHG